MGIDVSDGTGFPNLGPNEPENPQAEQPSQSLPPAEPPEIIPSPTLEGTTSLWQRWEQRPDRAWRWTVLWIAGLTTIAYLWHLGSIGLVDETEPLFAEAARQMLVREDWVTPYFNETTRFDKPPLIYWCMAVAYQVLGVNEWAVRLPSALAAIGLIALAAWVVRRYGLLPRAGWGSQGWSTWPAVLMTTAMMAFNGEMIAWGRTGVSDMLLTGCIDGALLCFFMGYSAAAGSSAAGSSPAPDQGIAIDRAHSDRPSADLTHSDRAPSDRPSVDLTHFDRAPSALARPDRPTPDRATIQTRWYFAFYTCIALAILAKGPVGIVLPGVIIVPFLLYTGQFWPIFKEIFPLRGLAWVALMTVPWYILVIQANGQAYIDSFFGYHNFERFTQVVNQHSAPWYFYFLVVLAGFAPWSLYIPAAIGRLRLGQWRRWQETPRQEQLGLFAGFWFFGIFLFFTIAVTKLPSYVLPLMPAAAILVALFWQDCLLPSPRSPVLRLSPALWASVLLNTLSFFLLGGVALSATNWIGEAVYDPAMPEFPIALQESPLLLRCGLLFLGTGLVLVGLLVKRRYSWLGGANLASFVLLMLLVLLPALNLVDTHRQLPLRSLAQEMVNQRRPGEEILMLGIEKPSLVFYSHYPIFFARHDEVILKHLEEVVLPQAQPDTFLLLTHPDRPSGLGLEPPNYEVLSAAGAYELVRVPKAQFLR
ncbi:MAG: glycosyltransferase family 39 protein [Prochlorothrix sp.]|nr:glycosyltransferase family 39 protein [Prochlorothrix sp.]